MDKSLNTHNTTSCTYNATTSTVKILELEWDEVTSMTQIGYLLQNCNALMEKMVAQMMLIRNLSVIGLMLISEKKQYYVLNCWLSWSYAWRYLITLIILQIYVGYVILLGGVLYLNCGMLACWSWLLVDSREYIVLQKGVTTRLEASTTWTSGSRGNDAVFSIECWMLVVCCVWPFSCSPNEEEQGDALTSAKLVSLPN